MLCLFYFALESVKMSITAVVLEKRFYFSPFYSFFIFHFNSQCQLILGQFIPQFINVIATNNDLLMDELNAIYFAPKLWPYVLIWLPRTTDNSTFFAQSLEIRGIESRLYLVRLISFTNTFEEKPPIQVFFKPLL